MPEYPSTCIMCRAAGVIGWPDFGEGDHDPVEREVARSAMPDEQYEHQVLLDDFVDSVESRIKSGRHEHLCEACNDKVEAKFRRDDRSWEGTLAEVLHADNGLFGEALLERVHEHRDPDAQLVRKLFPCVEVPRPANAKSNRSVEAVAESLRRVGKPVVYFDPALAAEDEPPYVLHVLKEGAVCVDYLEACNLVAFGEVACALDYAPDGTLLEGHAGN